MWERIFSISFTGSKRNPWKTIIHFITAYNSSLNIYQPKIKCKDGGSYFYKNRKWRQLGKEKNVFFSYFISKIPNFSSEYSFTSFFLQCGLHALLSLFVMHNPQHSILLFRSYRLCCCYLKLLVVDIIQTGAKCFVSEVEFYGLQ